MASSLVSEVLFIFNVFENVNCKQRLCLQFLYEIVLKSMSIDTALARLVNDCRPELQLEKSSKDARFRHCF